MLGLRDLGWIIQWSGEANFSQIAKLIEAPNGNILAKLYFSWNVKPNRSKTDGAIGISRNADFTSYLATRAPGPRVANLIDAALSIDA